MSNYTVKDLKVLIAEYVLPYRIIRVNGIYRLLSLVPSLSKLEKHTSPRHQAEAAYAGAISDIDEMYKRLNNEGELKVAKEKELADEIMANRENLAGLSDEELAKHMDKPNG